jgi:hypothetical protein
MLNVIMLIVAGPCGYHTEIKTMVNLETYLYMYTLHTHTHTHTHIYIYTQQQN